MIHDQVTMPIPYPLPRKRRISLIGAALSVLWFATPGLATFHFMQVEQVIGGVNGDTSAQAIQLRMRFNLQHLVDRGRLIAWDAEGQNPVVLLDFPTPVAGSTAGSRVLIASASFLNFTNPPTEPDFVLTNPIPESYFAAGSITFESKEDGLIVWRLSWGGAGYTGPTTGAFTNDDDGEFGPPFPGPLPSVGIAGLLFQGSFTALSISNDSDYAVTDGAAVVTNNAVAMFTVRNTTCPDDPSDDPIDSDGDGLGDLCDLCPHDPDKIEPGTCGCGVSDADLDGNGIPDCLDDQPDGADPPPWDGGHDHSDHDDSDHPPEDAPPNDGDPDEPNGDPTDVGEPHEDDDGESNGPENPGSRPRACGLGLIPVGILSLLLLGKLRFQRSREG